MITKKNQQKLTFFIILLFNSLGAYPIRSRARLRARPTSNGVDIAF